MPPHGRARRGCPGTACRRTPSAPASHARLHPSCGPITSIWSWAELQKVVTSTHEPFVDPTIHHHGQLTRKRVPWLWRQKPIERALAPGSTMTATADAGCVDAGVAEQAQGSLWQAAKLGKLQVILPEMNVESVCRARVPRPPVFVLRTHLSLSVHQLVKEALDAQTVALDDIDADGNTLLHMAAGQGQKLLVKELLRRGADPRVINFGGKTCYDAAHELNYWELGDYIRDKLGLEKLGPRYLHVECVCVCVCARARVRMCLRAHGQTVCGGRASTRSKAGLCGGCICVPCITHTHARTLARYLHTHLSLCARMQQKLARRARGALAGRRY